MSNNVKTVDLSDHATLMDCYKKLSKSHADLRAELAAAQDHRIDTDKWLATEKSRSGKLEAENARLRAELAAERERVEAATHYATQITVWTVETFFEPDKTGWKPLTELLGVLSQLDNALVGVREKRDKLREALERAREALIRISEKDTNADIVNGLEEGPCARIADKAIGAIADVLRETGVLDE